MLSKSFLALKRYLTLQLMGFLTHFSFFGCTFELVRNISTENLKKTKARRIPWLFDEERKKKCLKHA